MEVLVLPVVLVVLVLVLVVPWCEGWGRLTRSRGFLDD